MANIQDHVCESIILIGKEKCDIAYYLLELATNHGSKVLAIDNSVTGKLHAILSGNEEDAFVEGINLCSCRGQKASKSEEEKYDYIFYYYGRNYDGLKEKANYYIISEDMESFTEERLKKASKDFEPEVYFVVRDCVLKNSQVKAFVENTGFNVRQTFVLPLDSDDERLYINITRDGISSAKSLSVDMKDTLKFLSSEIFKIPEKSFKREIKKVGAR